MYALVGREISRITRYADRVVHLDPLPGDVGLLLNETIKTMVFDLLAEASLSKKSPSMQMMLQEIAAGLLAAHLKSHLGYIGIAHGGIQFIQSAQPGYVGYGFYIEYQGWGHDCRKN